MVTCACQGCACICDDVEVDFRDSDVEVRNACRKGYGVFKSHNRNRLQCQIEDEKVDIDRAIEKAVDMLKDARKVIIYGLDNSSLEAQEKGIELAKKLDAFIDDTSSICEGVFLERIYDGRIKTCTLDDVRNNADLIIYWGSNASNSHPRHLSKFSYFPRGENTKRGYEDRESICIDVRKSPTAKVCGRFYKVPVSDGDEELIRSMLDLTEGKMRRTFLDRKDMIELLDVLKKAKYGVIFSGLGLVYSIQDKIELFERFMDKLNEFASYHLIPMVGHYNMRGFTEKLFEKTKYINRVNFEDGKIHHGEDCSMTEVLRRGKADTAMIIGSDPLSSLPFSSSKKLIRMNTITIDPHRTLTSEISKVRIPSAITGIECEGYAIRMDGVALHLDRIVDSDYQSDEYILKSILKKL